MGQGLPPGSFDHAARARTNPRRLGSIGARDVRYGLEGTGLIDPDGNPCPIGPTSASWRRLRVRSCAA